MGNQVTQMDKNELLEQHTSTSSKSFPKTTIISISTHGEIRLNKEITNVSDIKYDTDGLASSVLPVFQINPNIKEFYKYNAVVPGVFSYAGGNSDFGDGMDAEKSSRSKNGNELGDLIVGEDRNFRPVDMEFAPDGSLYVIDWHNILIGHMQHNARDPLRDHSHGRVYRITYPSRPLVVPAKVSGASIDELLENLK
jgi:hypothetical protein